MSIFRMIGGKIASSCQSRTSVRSIVWLYRSGHASTHKSPNLSNNGSLKKRKVGLHSQHDSSTEDDERRKIFWEAMRREVWPQGDSKKYRGLQYHTGGACWCPNWLTAFLYSLNLWTQSRKCCRGVNKGVGWAPLRAQKDDAVCVFQASALPHIIRRTSDGELQPCWTLLLPWHHARRGLPRSSVGGHRFDIKQTSLRVLNFWRCTK